MGMYTREMKINTAKAYVYACRLTNSKIPTHALDCSTGVPGSITDLGTECFNFICNLQKDDFERVMKNDIVSEWWNTYSHWWLIPIERIRKEEKRKEEQLRKEAEKDKILESILSKLNPDERKFIENLIDEAYYAPMAD